MFSQNTSLTPTTGSPMVSYTTGFGNWQNFVLDRVDADHNLIRWKANLGYCVNIPGGVQNATLNFYPCNAGDSDQRFRITTVGGLPNYVSPVANNSTGVLESANGSRLSLPGNNSTVGLVAPNDSDIENFWSGVFTRIVFLLLDMWR